MPQNSKRWSRTSLQGLFFHLVSMKWISSNTWGWGLSYKLKKGKETSDTASPRWALWGLSTKLWLIKALYKIICCFWPTDTLNGSVTQSSDLCSGSAESLLFNYQVSVGESWCNISIAAALRSATGLSPHSLSLATFVRCENIVQTFSFILFKYTYPLEIPSWFYSKNNTFLLVDTNNFKNRFLSTEDLKVKRLS